MFPTIKNGDKLIIDTNCDELNENDIILYYLFDKKLLVAHRIIRICKNIIFVKGDNVDSIDNPIRKNHVIGKVVNIIRSDNGIY